MRRMNYLGFVVAAASALAMSCSGEATPDGGGDAAADAPPTEQTYTFVVDQLTVDPTDNPDTPHTGFNLDNLFSTDIDAMGCTHPDYFSQYDNDQHCTSVTNEQCTVMPNPGCARTAAGCHGGVDNQLPTLANTIQTAANTDIRMTLSDTITQNKLALIVRVSHVNDPMNDDSIRVAIYRAFPTFTSGCTSVAGGREYTIDSSFLTGGSDIDANANVAFDGKIVNGRIQVQAGGSGGIFNLPISFSGFSLNLPLHEVQLRANLTTGASAALDSGDLGGWVGGDDVINAVAMLAPDYVAVVRGVIGGLVDIQIMGICDGSSMNPARYGGISVGLGIHALPATISTTTPSAAMQAAGTCGYTPPGDAGGGG